MKKNIVYQFSLILLVGMSFSYTLSAQTGSIKTITIETQEWMSENLKVTKFNNGDPIPYAKTEAEWQAAAKAKKPAYCYSQNPKYKDEVLYNYYVLTDKRGILPNGFAFPNGVDFDKLSEVFSQDVKQVSVFNFKRIGARHDLHGYDYFAGSEVFWYMDGEMEGFLSDGLGQSTGVSQIGEECLDKFPLGCDGTWFQFETYYSTGGSTAGSGMSIRLIKKH